MGIMSGVMGVIMTDGIKFALMKLIIVCQSFVKKFWHSFRSGPAAFSVILRIAFTSKQIAHDHSYHPRS